MSTEPIAAVLHHTADAIEASGTNLRGRIESAGAGGATFQQIFESARSLYGGSAVLHLERYLGVSQLQHWDVQDVAAAAEQIRAAAGTAPDMDVEVAALLRRIRGFHAELAEAAGSDDASTGALLGGITRRVERMQLRAERAEQLLAECRSELAQARQQLKARPTVTAQAPLFELEAAS